MSKTFFLFIWFNFKHQSNNNNNNNSVCEECKKYHYYYYHYYLLFATTTTINNHSINQPFISINRSLTTETINFTNREKTIMIESNDDAKYNQLQWATEILNTATPTSTSIYRSFDPTTVPCLGFEGCLTYYEALRRGLKVSPYGPCLGFRAVSTTGSATPFIYSTYTEVVARVDSIAAGLDDLNLVQKNEDGLLLVSAGALNY